MATPHRVQAPDSAPGKRSITAGESHAWVILRAAGLLFLVVGLADVAIAWHPFGFGQPEWEFATVTTSLNGLPAPTIGLALIAASAVVFRQVALAKTLAVVFSLLALLVVAGSVLYATNIPIALQSVPAESIARIGLKKAMLKTAIQVVVYTCFFVWLAVLCWRRVKQAA